MSFSKKTAAVVLLCFMLLSLTACGDSNDEPYVSPSFNNESDDNQKVDLTTENEFIQDATPGDAELEFDASPTDAEASDAVKASLTDASLMAGVYEGETYYNNMAGFCISTADTGWKFYDAAGVASATGLSTEDVNNFWYGYKSVKDSETSYCAICYDTETGSNIIVSYINPEINLQPEITAENYLAMALNRYENLVIKRVSFLGDTWACLDIPEEQSAVGRRVCYAKKQDGIIILVTFTMQDGQELYSAQELFTRLSN